MAETASCTYTPEHKQPSRTAHDCPAHARLTLGRLANGRLTHGLNTMFVRATVALPTVVWSMFALGVNAGSARAGDLANTDGNTASHHSLELGHTH